MNFLVNLGGKILSHPVGLGPGVCKTVRDVEIAAQSKASFIIHGATTFDERHQNEGVVYHRHLDRRDGSLLHTQNSLGMPNRGRAALKRDMPKMVRITHDAGKLLFENAAGFTPDESAILVELALEGGVDGIEINGGCPNVWVAGVQKPIMSYSPESIEATLNAIERRVGKPAIPVWVKLSPFVTEDLLEPIHSLVTDRTPLFGFEVLERIGGIIATSELCAGVTLTNTLGNTLCLAEDGTPAITYLDGLAGLGGPALKPIALENIRFLRPMLREDQFVIGAGGIMTWRDVADYRAAGADAVYATSGYWEFGNKIFDKILLGAIE
ncbi:MAG: hypothetical protein Q8R39_02640 [bacterium]|nr:hypothetical protein [bacterium]MDZ4284890.1 hypothetical protein [Patescibacteria group bacterium]